MSEDSRPESPLVLDRIKKLVEEIPEVELAVVFGSFARGRERADSDVDLGLILDGSSAARRREIEAALHRAARRSVDVIYLDEAPPLLRFEIARDGVPLLESRPHRWADFRVRAMHDWWDWAPYARRLNDAAIGRLREKVADGPA